MGRKIKTATRIIAAALAALTLMPNSSAAAEELANSTAAAASGSSSAVQWYAAEKNSDGTYNLPTDGDGKYITDGNWHRIVLEFGDYSTNSTDSEGNYADTSPATASSWMEKAWWGSELAGTQPENWPGKNKTERVTTGTRQRTEDQALYANCEYSESGRYALYIKYAGVSEKNNYQPCYYISPCDENGNREEKLWALDCAMNFTSGDVTQDMDEVTDNDAIFSGTGPSSKGSEGPNVCGARPIRVGACPTFTLLTPTFDEYENSDNFKYAGVEVPWYHRGGQGDDGWRALLHQKTNTGAIRCKYEDNNKWIITQNSDGSWSVKSAGYVDWDWSDPDGDFAKLFEDPAKQLSEGIAAYIKIVSWAKYAEDINKKYSDDDDNADYSIIRRYYLVPWIAITWAYYYVYSMFTQLVPMIYLSEYVQNAYITAEYQKYGVTGFDADAEGFEGAKESGSLYVSVHMRLNVNVSEEQLIQWINQDIGNSRKLTDDDYTPALRWVSIYSAGYYSDTGRYPAEQVGVSVYKESSTGDVESYYTIDEIKESISKYITMTSDWQPSAGKGAFSAVYIGLTLETEAVSGTQTVEGTEVLGKGDSNSDGYSDGAAIIGTPGALKGTGSTGATIEIAEGAVLQIDGPVFAAMGSAITVKGTLIINSGGALCAEEVAGTGYESGTSRFFNLVIDGGTVYISRDAIVDLGYGNFGVKNGGELINKGAFIQGTADDTGISARTIMQGGSIDNDTSAWFITGANVYMDMRRSLLKNTANNSDLTNLSNYICNVYDRSLDYYKETQDKGAVIYSDMYMANGSCRNVFRNSGNAFISGAIKGESEENSYFVGQGALYRARDLYNDGNITVPGTTLRRHKEVIEASGKTVYTDETLQGYYALYGIEENNSETIINEDGETQAIKNNVLALKVGTGSTGTGNISGFKLIYEDQDGYERIEYIDTSSIYLTYDFVSNWAYCGEEENQKGDSILKTHGTDGVMSAGNFPTTLEPLSNSVYLFETLYTLKYVKSLTIMGAGTDAWTCTELSLYRVSYLYPLQEYGWSSKDWYVPFSGTLLASAALQEDSTGVKSYNFSWDSEEIVLGSPLYQLNVYGVPADAKVESLTDQSGFTYYNVSRDTVSYTTGDEDYVFSVSLADAADAGMEAFYNVAADLSMTDLMSDSAWVEKLKNDTKLDIQLVYLDTNGSARQVTLPFTQSAVEWAYTNMDSASRDENLHGVFQQGEDIVFSGILPDFSKLFYCYITYTDKNDGDSIAIASVAISNPAYIDVEVSEGMLKTDYPDSALYFYCASGIGGTVMNSNQTMNLSMKAWNGTESLKPQAKGSRYLVVVQTDEMSDAATVNELSISFKYKTLTNIETSTGEYSLRGAVEDYYGYWLSSDGTGESCAYDAAVCAGGQMYFTVDIANLYKFTSATLTMSGSDSDYVSPVEKTSETDEDGSSETDEESYPDYASSGKDEWQMSSITIYELSELGAREVLLGTGISTSSTSTNRTYYRDNVYGSRGAINSGKGPLMIGPGQSKTISFEDGSISGDEISENKATKIDNLTYEETKQEFGFNTARVKYTVGVKVAGTAINSLEDGDCGSQNQFYFQLVFQSDEGKLYKSPYTLANQQLSSDGFRTAMTETFYIYTNDDYGTPVQINIIPDDTSSTSDVFDKLCIEYITVDKTSGTGVNMSWKASDVGWIDIEYKEEAEEQEGRSDEELIRSFELKDDGYKVWLEFGIETAAEYIEERQFIGKITADITYRDSTGAVKVMTDVAVVNSIADYANRLSEVAEGLSGTEISVPSYMFKKGTTNRFFVQFDDISSLVKIKFKVTPEENRGLSINKVFVRQVYDKGTLSINVFNEYERYYSVDAQDLTATNNAKPVKAVPMGNTVSVTLDFNSGNTIQIDPEEESLEIEEGVSEGENDYITIAATLADTTGIDASATLPVNVIYKNIYGDAYAIKTTLVYDADSGKFVVADYVKLNTPDIGMPYQVEVTGGSLAGRVLTNVVVNQLRQETVIGQFNFVPAEGTKLGSDVPVTISIEESRMDEYAEEMGYTTETQNVFLLLGSQTQKTLLTESKDIQVALVYTEKDDPYNYEHTSEYASALDSGYTIISSGTVLSIPMNVGNVGSIKSVMVKTTDSSMTADIEKGCIALYKSSDLTGSNLSTGWASISAPTGLISTEGTSAATDSSDLTAGLTSATRITPVKMALKLDKINRSDAMVRVTLCYKDASGAVTSVSCEKAASEWNNGDSWLLVSGMKSQLYYKIEVYDRDATNLAGVTLSSAEISWYGEDGFSTPTGFTGEKLLVEGSPYADSLISTSLTGTVTAAGGTGTAKLENNSVSSAAGNYSVITLKEARGINISASLPGLAGELEATMVNTTTGESVFGTVSAGSTQESLVYSGILPANTGNETVRYTLSVRARDLPEVYCAVIYIDVQPAVKLEGSILSGDVSLIADISAYDSNGYTDLSSGAAYASGDTIAVYVRADNSTGGTAFSTDPSGAFTVTSTQGCTLEGKAGTYTKYLITAGTVQSQTACTFKVWSTENNSVSYTLKFTVGETT